MPLAHARKPARCSADPEPGAWLTNGMFGSSVQGRALVNIIRVGLGALTASRSPRTAQGSATRHATPPGTQLIICARRQQVGTGAGSRDDLKPDSCGIRLGRAARRLNYATGAGGDHKNLELRI